MKNEINKLEVTVKVDAMKETIENIAAISRLIKAHNTDVVSYGANLDLDMRITTLISNLLDKEIEDLNLHIGRSTEK